MKSQQEIEAALDTVGNLLSRIDNVLQPGMTFAESQLPQLLEGRIMISSAGAALTWSLYEEVPIPEGALSFKDFLFKFSQLLDSIHEQQPKQAAKVSSPASRIGDHNG